MHQIFNIKDSVVAGGSRCYYLLLPLLAACGSNASQAPPPPPPVTVQTVGERIVTSYQTYPGTVVPLEEVQLQAEVTGYVTDILFEEGQVVEKGKKLYEIDPTVYRAEYGEAQANVARAEANYRQAQRDAERYTRLHEQDAIAEQAYENAITTQESTKTELEAARATARVARTNLGYANIAAPFTGTIGVSDVKRGNLVTRGQTILNTLSTNDPMAIDFEVNEKQLPRLLRLLEQASDRVSPDRVSPDRVSSRGGTTDSVFTIRLPDGSDYPANGELLLIDRAVNRQTGTIRARLSVPNDKGYLRAGMNVTVRVRQRSDTPQVTIPYRAVTEQMGEYFVFVLGDSSQVSERRIRLKRQVGDQAIVQDGLQTGERIAVTGIQKLSDGTQVRVKEEGGSSEGAGRSAAE